MTSKQKAEALVFEYSCFFDINGDSAGHLIALSAVEEVIEALNQLNTVNTGHNLYWEEVKEEIKKL